MRFDHLSVGFIGCGRIAPFHADVLAQLGVRITAVCGGGRQSLTARSFAARYEGARVYPDWSSLLSGGRCDLLWVLTPWYVTGDLLPALARDGRPVLAEKPLAGTSEAIAVARAVIEQKRSNAFNIVCGMNRRHYDFMPKLRRVLAEETIECVAVTISEQTRYRSGDADVLRHLWIHSAIHEVDLVRHLFGPMSPIRIYRTWNEDGSYWSNVNALLLPPGGSFPVFLMANWDSSERKGILIEARGGKTFQLRPIETLTVATGLRRVEPTRDHPIAEFEPVVLERREAAREFKPGFLNQTTVFLEHVVNGTLSEYAAESMNDAWAVMKLIEELAPRQPV